MMLYSDSEFDDGDVLLSAAPLKNWNSPNLDVETVRLHCCEHRQKVVIQNLQQVIDPALFGTLGTYIGEGPLKSDRTFYSPVELHE